MKNGRQLVRTTGFEFASDQELIRDERYARYVGNRKLLFRILMEKQHRRWTDEQRRQCFIPERFYHIENSYTTQLYMYMEPLDIPGSLDPID